MTVRRIAIVGAGTMGSGIAINAVQHGLVVTLLDAVEGTAERAKLRAAHVLGRFVEKGRMKAEERAAALARLELGDGLADVAKADLIVEAVFEDFATKAAMFEELSRHARPDTVIATNTSALRVSRLADHVARPERFLGLHYFSPAEINPVCEVVSGARTARQAVEEALAFLAATRRVALPCKDAPGFALNRFFCPYTNEAARLLGEGLGTTTEIDNAAEAALGAAAGPFRVMNIIKPRINLNAIRNIAELGPFYAPAAKLIEVGESDQNFDLPPLAGPIADDRLADMAARIRAAVFLPVLQELDEGVADPATIDTGAKLAFKFAEPPCAMMDRLGRAEVERLIAPLLAAYGLARPASLERVGRLVA